MNWISVKDRLPGTEVGWCIVLTKNSDEMTFAFMALHNKGEWGYLGDDNKYQEEMKVTHWIPLPELSDE